MLLLAGRLVLRRWLVAQRLNGRLAHRVLVVGDPLAAAGFVARLAEEPAAGFTVVATCLPEDAVALVRTTGADVVAVTASEVVTPERLRELAWQLEGADVDLVVAPAMTDVAGPRVTMRPVAGLPLLYVDEPRFTGGARLVKGTLDRLVALVALVLLAPLFAVVAVAIKLTSSGPVFFRQQRIGQDWAPFPVWKLRTMYADAEQQLGRAASGQRGGRPAVQDQGRPAGDAAGPAAAAHLDRRAAAAGQRAARADVAGRAAAAGRRRRTPSWATSGAGTWSSRG